MATEAGRRACEKLPVRPILQRFPCNPTNSIGLGLNKELFLSAIHFWQLFLAQFLTQARCCFPGAVINRLLIELGKAVLVFLQFIVGTNHFSLSMLSVFVRDETQLPNPKT